MVRSFRVKLVAYFVLLSVLPIVAAYWGFSSVAGQSETRRVDARLETGIGVVLSAQEQRLDRAQHEALDLAGSPRFQSALRARRRAVLARLLRSAAPADLTGPGGLYVGRSVPSAPARRAAVVSEGRLLGTISVYVPLDHVALATLRRSAGFDAADVLVALRGPTVVASAARLHGTLRGKANPAGAVTLGGVRYRAFVGPDLAEPSGLRLAVLSPEAFIDAANVRARNRLLAGLLASLAVVSLVAFLEGRSIVRGLRSLASAARSIAGGRLEQRVDVRGRDELAQLGTAFNEMAAQLERRLAELEEERNRLRDSLIRFGEVLEATHDDGQLLPLIVDAAFEATSASLASLRVADGGRVERGDPGASGERIELPLQAGREQFGRLVLVGETFDDDARMAAASLASQATIALANVRLHRTVERLALVDDLTGLANRRQCEDALRSELARASRMSAPLTLVLADIDDFKAVNDVYGHQLGDDVLREFAVILRDTVRESDLAGRWGGEEFLLVLPGTDSDGGVQLADRIRTALEEHPFAGLGGQAVHVTCSCGVAQHIGGGVGEVFAAADRALYTAKRSGKNRVVAAAPVRTFQ